MVYAMKEICRRGQPDKGKKSKNAYNNVVKRKICGMVSGKKSSVSSWAWRHFTLLETNG